LVSVPEPAHPALAGGSGDSWGSILSPDGRYVLFASTANNLVANSSSNHLPLPNLQKLNVFLRDRTNGTTTLASVNVQGTGGGDDDSLPTALTDDGRYVLFESAADNLAAGATNVLPGIFVWTEIFVHDLVNNTTELVSISTNGGVANGVCRGSTMTPDGRCVAFTSAANNLVPNDTNGIADVFVRDLQAGTTTLVSVGATAPNRYFPTGSESPDITPDGRYVAFYSTATNLVPGALTGGQIYVRDLVAGTTTWVSSGAHGILGITNILAFNHAISDDGQFVAYEACTNPPPASGHAHGVVLRYNLSSGLTDLVNTNGYVPSANPEEIRSLQMSPDGRFITFVANTDRTPGTTCIDLWDAQSGTTTLVSVDLNGNASTNAIYDWPTVEPTGRYVAFLSSATNLVTNPLTGDYHLYLRDLQTGTTLLLDADTNGVGSSISPATAPRLSTNATTVAFECRDANLVPNDYNNDYDVFLRDLTIGATELISSHDPAFPSRTPDGPSGLTSYSVSRDGRLIAFTSDADNLVPNDTNGFRDVFVRDLLLGTNTLVSVATNGFSADDLSSQAAISGDGRYVAFISSAGNLVPGVNNRTQNVFLRDLFTDTTALVSVNTNGNGPGNGLSESPTVSADGRFVLFSSMATNLVPIRIVFGTENLFLRDMQAGHTYALTTDGGGNNAAAVMTPDGRFIAFADIINIPSSSLKINIWDSQVAAPVYSQPGRPPLSISPDGSKLAFFSAGYPYSLLVVDRAAGTTKTINTTASVPGLHARLRFSGGGRFLAYTAAPSYTNQVYLYDFATQSNFLVTSAAASRAAGNAASDSPDISVDGRFVAYRSSATNLLVPPTSNTVPNLFLYDRFAGTSTLLTASRYSDEPADNRSLLPVFSGDGRTLVFQSWASDLVPQDFNHWDDVFALNFLYLSISPAEPSRTGSRGDARAEADINEVARGDSGKGRGRHGPDHPGPGRRHGDDGDEDDDHAPRESMILTWPARPGESYQVQYKDTLAGHEWQALDGTITITGNQAQMTNSPHHSGQRFYRLVAHPNSN
jgi:Tol biopolymer transport system component